MLTLHPQPGNLRYANNLNLPDGVSVVAVAGMKMICFATAANQVDVLSVTRNPGTIGTVQATTSGTAFDFTIPSWAKSIDVCFAGVSLSGTDSLLVQLGDAGGIETSGYTCTCNTLSQASGSSGTNSTAGFLVSTNSAATDIVDAVVSLRLVDPAVFLWVESHTGKLNATNVLMGGGDKSLSEALTTVRVTRSATDTFDLGKVNVRCYP